MFPRTVRRVVSVFLPALLLFASSGQPMSSQTPSRSPSKTVKREGWVDQTLQELSNEEKVGQLIMPAFRAVYLHSKSEEMREIERQIHQHHVGGFILFGGDVYEAAVLIDKVQATSKLPLLVASDFERGANFRLRNTVSFPWNMAIGATGSEHWAYLQGKATGMESRALGVNWIFAPVLDINNNPANPVINIRSYGEDPELVAKLGAAFIRGAQEAGVMATAKHFPGHGDTAVDSHLSLPVMNMDRQRLEALELIPFKRAIQSGVWSVMTAHLAVPAIEPDSGVPATLSNKVLEGLLQKDLGFSKLVVTDSLTMAGLAEGYWAGDAALRAFKAGVDILLDSPNPDAVYQSLLQAVRSGEISRKRLDHSVRKILEAKAWLGLHRKRRVDLQRISQVVSDPGLQEQAQQMADASVTLVRDQNGIIPLDVRRLRSAHAVMVLSRDLGEETGTFEKELRQRLDSVSFDRLSLSSSDLDMEASLEKAHRAELVVCAIFARIVTGTGSVGLSEKLGKWVERFSQLERPVATIALGTPYVIQGFPAMRTYLCTFSNADVSQTAAVKALFGEISVKGKLPVTLPGVAALHSGLDRERSAMILSGVAPSESIPVQGRIQGALDPLIEEQIGKRAFPGAALAVGHRGKLVFQKGYGRLDYSAKAPAVTNETIYDLASLTKVITATTLVMQLYERGELKLEHPASRYFPRFVGEGRDKITIRHLLTHTSGLPAHLPLYKDLKGKAAFVEKILQIPLESTPGTKAVYSDLGLILLGDIIEKLAAKPLDELAAARIFQPLGMTHTFFHPKPQRRKMIAPTENDPWRGRLLRGEVHDENAFAMGGVSAHAGLFGNTGDLAIFCQMLLNGGVYDHRRIVRHSTLEKFTARQNFPEGSSRALGWDTPSNGSSAGSLLSQNSFGHTGFTGTSIWIDPTRELFIVLLTNRVHPTRENNAIREVRRMVADGVVKAVDLDPLH
jgi:beta-glucosidase-like glycosyl hydrolase/CubicO group peptidase (beta-lactamase class C family)